MSSTSQNSQPFAKKQPFLQKVLQGSPLSRLHFRFLGSRVLLPVLGSSLLGIVGVAFVCSEIVKQQAEQEIQTRLENRVYAIDSALTQANTLAKALRTSLLTLHLQDAKIPETYRKLTLEMFKTRPAAVTGIGFGQSPNGLLPNRQWLFSYFFLNSQDPNSAGQLLPAPDNEIRYLDGIRPGSFYPESDRYRNFFLPQTDLWTLPYQSANGIQTSYYVPIFDDRDRWLGTVFVDVDSRFLQENLAGSVLENGGYFAMLTPEGQVVSAPAIALGNSEASYQSIPGLAAVWSQIVQGQSGLIKGKQGYWVYSRVPQNRWLAIAFVPYGAVFQPVQMTIGITVLVAGLLLLVLILTLRSLDRRLRPLLDECDRLDALNESIPVRQDEIDQISGVFFWLLGQLKASTARIQQDAEQIRELEAQLMQGATAELEQKTLQAEVEHLFKVVGSVEQGDLQIAAQVSSEKTGAVAETLNRLVHRLGEVMGSVVSYASEVTQETQQLQRISALVSDAARQQLQEADQAEAGIAQIQTIAEAAAQQTLQTAEAVAATRQTIHDGEPEISGMMRQVKALRQGTDQLVKRTQTLTSYVELTTQFARDQKRIAAMTRVLAANASMLASRASGQQDPDQFAVITREFETIATQVNQLASQTNQSLVLLQQRTDQIQTVVSGLDYDIQGMSQQINQFDSGIDRMQALLEQMQFVSDAVAQLGQSCSDSHQAIAVAAQNTLESIHQIAAVASTTLDRTELTQEQVQTLEQQVETLLQQVEFFKFQPLQHRSDVPQLVGAATKNGTSETAFTRRV